jgi:hypothetical protein
MTRSRKQLRGELRADKNAGVMLTIEPETCVHIDESLVALFPEKNAALTSRDFMTEESST